jgi:hypothetical protein
VLSDADSADRTSQPITTTFQRWSWVLLVALVIVVYGRTVGFGLYNDDYLLIRPWSAHDLLKTFHDQFDGVNYEQKYYRPLASVSFAFEWKIWGTNRWGYHLTNIAIHSAAVVAVWLVLRRLRVAWWAALVGAAYFAVVPSNAAAVVYIAERTDAIVAIGICVILGCVARFAATSATRWLWCAAAVYVIALMFKEVATAAPVFVAVYWLYIRVESHEPAATAGGLSGVRAHWAGEIRIIGRSIFDRSARWATVVIPLVVVTAGYIVYRSAVLPGLSDRFSEGSNPLRALADGVASTIKGTPWENRTLPFLPVLLIFMIGVVLRPCSRAWRVVLLGVGMIIAGVLPLTFSGSVEPRLLYVAEIGLAVAIGGIATVLGEAVSHSTTRTVTLRVLVGAATALVCAAVAVGQFQSQNLYKPGSSSSLYHDLQVWVYPENVVVPADNLREVERHLREAGLIDENGNLTSEFDG